MRNRPFTSPLPRPTAARRLGTALLAALLLVTGCQSRPDATDAEITPPWPADTPERDTIERSALERRVHRKLRQPISVDYENERLDAVIDDLRRRLDINIDVEWNALEIAGVKPETELTLELADVQGRTVLGRICNTVNNKNKFDPIAFATGNGFAVITTARVAKQKPFRSTQSYNIAHLLRTMTRPLPTKDVARAFIDPSYAESTKKGDGSERTGPSLFCGTPDDDDDYASWMDREDATNKVKAFVRETVGRFDEWVEHGGNTASLRVFRGHLWVRAPQDYHPQVVQRLRELRRMSRQHLAAQLRDIEVVHLIRRAERHRLQGDYAQALRLTNRAGNVDPTHPLAQAMRDVLTQTRRNLGQNTAPATQPASE